MKNLLFSCALLSLSFTCFAQGKMLNTFINKYQGIEDVTNINVSGSILNFITSATDEDGNKRFVSKLDRLRIISIPQLVNIDRNDILALKQGIQASNYEELIQIRDGKAFVHIYLHETKNNIIEELVILVEDADDFTLVSLSGQMLYEDLQSIELDGDAGEALKKLPKDHREPRP